VNTLNLPFTAFHLALVDILKPGMEPVPAFVSLSMSEMRVEYFTVTNLSQITQNSAPMFLSLDTPMVHVQKHVIIHISLDHIGKISATPAVPALI